MQSPPGGSVIPWRSGGCELSVNSHLQKVLENHPLGGKNNTEPKRLVYASFAT